MKKLVTIAIAAMAGQLLSGTVTWTGGGDGYTWSDGNNWSSGSNPDASFTDDLVIDGGSGVFNHVDGKKVIYNSGDMGFTGSLTIRGGATLYQDANSWPNFTGTVIVENGTFDMSHATGATKYGNVTIHDGGLVIIPSSFSRVDESVLTMDGGELRIGGSFSFKPNDSVTGGSIVCYGTSDFSLSKDLSFSGVSLTVYIVVPSNGAKLTLDGASLVATCSEKGQFGFYGRYAGVLNFVSGSPSSYTFPSSYAGTAAALYNAMVSSGYITLDGSAISESDFYSKFDVSFDTDAGTCTMSLKTLEGWSVGTPSAGEVDAQNNVTVTFTATKHSGSDTANVYVGCASSDLGDDIADWLGSLVTVAEGVSSTTIYTPQLTLADGLNFIRTFVTYGGDTVASSAISVRVLAYGDYGELTDVYEYIGEGNNLGDAANWAKDKSAPATEAPTAGTDIRWFGKNAYYSGSLAITAKDYFDGATLALSGDCNVSSDVVFSNTVISIATIVVSSPVVFSLYGSDMTTTRNDQWLGVYPPGTYTGSSTKTFVNFLSGKASSFTFTDNAINISDADSAKSDLVTPGYLKLDGAAIADTDWDAFFSVEVSGKTVKITYDPVVDENMILSVAFSDVTATSATLTASIFSIADGASVIVACDTAEITEANIIAKGETVIVNEGVATKAVTSLVSDNVYSFAFAIVQDNEVKAFKSGRFVASDFDYVYMDGAWLNGFAADMGKNANAPGGPDSALIIGTFSVIGQEVCPSRKKLKDAVVSANTILLSESADSATASMELCNSVYLNNKTGDLAATAPYGIYACPRPFNFTSASGNGVVRRGDAYVCYAISDQCAAVYSGLFENQKIRLEGQAVSEEMFRSSFSTNVVDTEKTIVINEETVPLKQLTVTYWEPFPASARDADWTVQTGARVKLTKNTRIGVLDIPDASDVKIDLNGYELKVSSLTIEGEKKKGEFTAEMLPAILTGEGKLVVGGAGFAIILR